MLADTLNIYEFCKTFSRTLNLRSRYSVDQLHQSLLNDGTLGQEIIVGLLDKFCVVYLENQSNSAVLNLVGQCKKQRIKNIELANSLEDPQQVTFGPLSFNISSEYIDEVDSEFQYYKQQLAHKSFKEFSPKQKQQLILFLINSIGYESDCVIQEVDERIKIIEARSNNSLKELPKKIKELNQLSNNISKKKTKEKAKELQKKQQLENEINLLEKAQSAQIESFYQNGVENLKDDLYLFVDEKRAIYKLQEESQWTSHTGEEMYQMIEKVNKRTISKFEKLGYFQVGDCKFDPLILDMSYDTEQLVQDEFNFEFYQNCSIQIVKEALLTLENSYSQYELNYWKSCWTSKEKREIWAEKVKSSEGAELMEIIGKLPHQLSWVNKKHGSSDPDAKFKSSRLYWFYQNKQYAQAYQQLSKQEPSLHSMYLLTVTLYDKLKSYIHRKMRSMDLQSQLDSTDEFDQQQQVK